MRLVDEGYLQLARSRGTPHTLSVDRRPEEPSSVQHRREVRAARTRHPPSARAGALVRALAARAGDLVALVRRGTQMGA